MHSKTAAACLVGVIQRRNGIVIYIYKKEKWEFGDRSL
jgi:hypothetical protein